MFPTVCSQRRQWGEGRPAGKLLVPVSHTASSCISIRTERCDSWRTKSTMCLICYTKSYPRWSAGRTAIERGTCPQRPAGYHSQVGPGSTRSPTNTMSHGCSIHSLHAGQETSVTITLTNVRVHVLRGYHGAMPTCILPVLKNRGAAETLYTFVFV